MKFPMSRRSLHGQARVSGLRQRRGLFLPLAAVVIVLVSFSAFFVSQYTSGIRQRIKTSHIRGKLNWALNSAKAEAMAYIFNEEPGFQSVPAASWWSALIPPYGAIPTVPFMINPVLTNETFADDGITAEQVEVRCLHMGAKNARCQGLIEVRVSAKCERDSIGILKRSRKSLYRFRSQTIPGMGKVIIVNSTPLAVEESL